MSPHPIEAHIEAQARHLSVLDTVTFLTSEDLRIGDEGDPLRLASVLWPLDEIATGYEWLAALADAQLARLDQPGRSVQPSDLEQLTLAITLASAFTDAMKPDPLLPTELLPQPWPGTRAALAGHPGPRTGRPVPERPARIRLRGPRAPPPLPSVRGHHHARRRDVVH
ncbi:PaaX family transcriptional regulator C-terminal domain-containing protein [Streptomyces sp. NPDC058611]|uniref:PaaX family transcriptional regulator C-terminal domain-containing protein n=1 Tax=unclassified Streptomyces TaxID=2593676 RepID=UPI00364DA213